MKFYSTKIMPKLNEFVVVKIIGHSDTSGILCQLLEYNNLDALILTTEISKYKVNIEKKFPLNKEFICFVYSIDEEKNHINLSVKNISKEESDEIMTNYINKVLIYNFINKILTKNNYNNIEDLICKYFDLNLNYNFDEFLNNIDNLNNIFDNNIIELFKSKLIKTNIELELKFNLQYLENNYTELIKKLNKNIKYISPGEYSIRLEFNNNINKEEYQNIFLEYFNEINKILENKKYILKFDINNIQTIKNSKYIIKNT